VFDFIKGGALGLKVGKSNFTPPGTALATAKALTAATGYTVQAAGAFEAFIDVSTSTWGDPTINNVNGTTYSDNTVYSFYTETDTVLGTPVFYNNSTGLKYAP